MDGLRCSLSPRKASASSSIHDSGLSPEKPPKFLYSGAGYRSVKWKAGYTASVLLPTEYGHLCLGGGKQGIQSWQEMWLRGPGSDL
jgi:hypothetical protein